MGIVGGVRVWSGLTATGALRELQTLCGLTMGGYDPPDDRKLRLQPVAQFGKRLPNVVHVVRSPGGQLVVQDRQEAADGDVVGQLINGQHRGPR
jgi:hypothetical protein